MTRESVYSEVRSDCTEEFPQVLKSKMVDSSVESLLHLKDSDLCDEIDSLCPMLKVAIQSSMGQNAASKDTFKAIRLQCYSLIFKARYGQNKYDIVAHRNDQLLLAAGGTKGSFGWFNKMGVTNSYSTANIKHKELAKDHDKEITDWKKRVEEANSISAVDEVPLRLAVIMWMEISRQETKG